MTISGSAHLPTRLVAIDGQVWAGLDEASRRPLQDRLNLLRPDLLVVAIDDSTDAARTPDADYLVSPSGGWILRLPAQEKVANAPQGPVTHSIRHLADELLIMPSAVTVLAGPDLPLPSPDDGWLVERTTDPSGIEAVIDRLLAMPPAVAAADLCDEGLVRAVDSLRRSVTDLGFTAASLEDNRLGLEDANYASVWARDGVMTGLWSLGLDDPEFLQTFAATLELLARHQASSGQIPAYIRLEGERPDYSGIGGIASIDSVLWFVIGAIRYSFHTGDRDFAKRMLGPIERAMAWLVAHDSNNDGLLEIPESSDWMDLFPRSYNVLYDEVLWYRACLDTSSLLTALDRDGSGWRREGELIGKRIVDLFWPTARQLMDLAGSSSGRYSVGEARYLLSQVTPFDFSWRCDVLANLLAALHGLLDEYQQQRLFDFLWGVGINQPFPVACLYPAVASGAEDWKDYFLVNFLNLPHHYHNGGVWPFIGGLWVRFLHRLGRQELAHRELEALAETNRQGLRGEWEFNEWLHGLTGRPMGKSHQAWSAASYIQAYLEVHKTVVSPDLIPLDPGRLR